MTNKVIWITGGSSGIGKALAYKFANEGWQVAISARREELLNKISKSNNNIHSFPLDVLDSEKCKDVFKKIVNKFKNVDIVLFSTGIHDPRSEKTFTPTSKIIHGSSGNSNQVDQNGISCIYCCHDYFSRHL